MKIKTGDLIKVFIETPNKEEHIGIVKKLSHANEFLIYRLDMIKGEKIKVFFLNTRQLFNNVELLNEGR